MIFLKQSVEFSPPLFLPSSPGPWPLQLANLLKLSEAWSVWKMTSSLKTVSGKSFLNMDGEGFSLVTCPDSAENL